MKKPFRLIPLLLAFCLAAPWVFPVGAAAAAPARAATRTVSSSEQFHSALAAAQDGDIIQVSGSFVVNPPQSNNDSLVIDKAVTIQGGSLTFWYAGILLGADVTFKDITLGLASNMRNAILANGHTLTLENVQRESIGRHIHLFCGGQTGATQGALSDAKQGSHGKIILKGNTNLGLANIYAGSISTDGTNNAFTKPATVTIDSSFRGQPIEHIYACGALQTPTSENDWFDYEHEIDPPCPYPGNFKVSGTVTFNLYQDRVGKVEGDTGIGGQFATVNYKGSDYLNDTLMLSQIGGLNVESGNLQPRTGEATRHQGTGANGLPKRTVTWSARPNTSCFGSANAPLTIAGGATLGLQKLGNVTAGNFTGGGNLVLGQSQKLTVAGTVSGTTTVGIGSIFNGHSQEIPIVGNTYIDAASSQAGSFTLAAPASRPDIKLVHENGAWTAAADATVVIVNDFQLASAVVTLPASSDDIEPPTLAFQNVQPANKNYLFASIPLTISVNNAKATMLDDNSSYTYTTDTLTLSVAENDDQDGEVLQLVNRTNETAPVPAGSYVISVTVPAANSGTGQPITRTATLVVRAAGATGSIAIAPTANTGLVYNEQAQVGVPSGTGYTLSGESATEAGRHTATATLADGYTWSDNTTDAKTISWTIAKADNLDLPTGLAAAAPTAYGWLNGKITGTTIEMQYSRSADFSGAEYCGSGETAELTAGDYYVRYGESRNYKAGPAVMITVPQGPVTVTSVAIATPATKTAYQTGEELDVTGLTLTVTMSDGNTYTVPVAAGMVSGFDSSSAAASQTLTVTYGGKTTTYTVSVAEASSGGDTGGGDSGNTGGDSGDSGNTGGGSGDSGNTGGGSTGGDSTGGGSSGGGAPSGSGSGADNVKNPDGSTTSTKTDKNTGVVTETTTHPDGSTLTVVTHPDGPVETTVKQADGLTASLRVDGGSARGEIRLPAQKEDTAAVALPIPALPGNDAQLSIHTGASRPVRVEIPIEGGTVTTVACFVDQDGTEHIVKTAFVEDGAITLTIPDEAVVRFRDGGKNFEDIGTHWAEEDIQFVTSRELFLGTTADTFAPNESMTRAMLTVVLARLDGVEVSGRSAYKDGIAWAVDKGISDGRDPGGQVTREQFITMLYRYAGSPAVTDAQLPFSDAASVSGYARDAVCWAAENGILNGLGDGSFRPKGNATRAQAASLLTRYVQYLNQQ